MEIPEHEGARPEQSQADDSKSPARDEEASSSREPSRVLLRSNSRQQLEKSSGTRGHHAQDRAGPVRRRTGEDGANSDHGSQRGSPRSRSPDGRKPLKAPGGPDEEAAKAAAETSPEMPKWAHEWADELAEAEGADPSWAYEWAEELNRVAPPAPQPPTSPLHPLRRHRPRGHHRNRRSSSARSPPPPRPRPPWSRHRPRMQRANRG